MSDVEFSIGPYVECIVEQVTTEEKYQACGGQNCPYYRTQTHNKFCPGCGKTTGETIRTSVRPKVNAAILQEDIDEDLHRIDHSHTKDCRQYWLPNKGYNRSVPHVAGKHLNSPNVILERNNDGTFSFIGKEGKPFEDMADPEAAIRIIEHLYQDALAALRLAYGEDKVTVRWGVVCWDYM